MFWKKIDKNQEKGSNLGLICTNKSPKVCLPGDFEFNGAQGLSLGGMVEWKEILPL